MEDREESNITRLLTVMSVVVLAVEPKANIASASLALPSSTIDQRNRDAISMEDREESNITRLLTMMSVVVLAVEPKANIAVWHLPSFATEEDCNG